MLHFYKIKVKNFLLQANLLLINYEYPLKYELKMTIGQFKTGLYQITV
ncbi:hypothetical protein HME9304_01927 [Flagellimonas maritima]|uniref:Uncharacterized protein n=1 Tax=Flagellimonas maritima TaxID=1383885 RepID=A0A2Z4LSM8_9FLAO|nr:hypothetical protein HME9304_01927 [Allomuricauda aurantiaca]